MQPSVHVVDDTFRLMPPSATEAISAAANANSLHLAPQPPNTASGRGGIFFHTASSANRRATLLCPWLPITVSAYRPLLLLRSHVYQESLEDNPSVARGASVPAEQLLRYYM